MNWLFKISTWRTTAVLLAANFTLQAIIFLLIYPMISATTEPLDTRVGLSEATIRAFLQEIGMEGRKIYALNELTLDMLFPMTYAVAYALLVVQLVKSCGQKQTPLKYLALLPIAIALCDVLENTLIVLGIQSWPVLNSNLVPSLAAANLCKHILNLLLLSALSVLLFWALGLRAWRQPTNIGN